MSSGSTISGASLAFHRLAHGHGPDDVNGRTRRVDITRGSTLQVQGGVGTTLLRIVDVGVVASGLWQLTDDSGTALPQPLRGARDRVYAAGPEIGLTIPPIRVRCTVRYEHDFLALSRPQGQVFPGVFWLPTDQARSTCGRTHPKGPRP